MEHLALMLLQSGVDADPTGGIWELFKPVVQGSPVAAVLGLFLWAEWKRRDKAEADNLMAHKTTQDKVDDVKEGYHGVREELIRRGIINGSGSH